MYPGLAEEEFFAVNQRRRQRLTDAERNRLIRAHAAPSGATASTWGRSLSRILQGVLGTVAIRAGGASVEPLKFSREDATAHS